MVQSSIQSNMLTLSNQRHDSQPVVGEDPAGFKPTKPFKYEVNPFDVQLLGQKRDQVISELQFLQENMNRLTKIESEVKSHVKVRDEDMDTTQNSNVKWFETAI